jgi:hypothetical protein
MTRLNQDHRRILLIDQNHIKQNLRATILRNYEIEVHTASNLTDAAALWTRYLYNLVLLAAPENSEEAVAATAQVRQVHPRQRIGLLVGPPVFIRELGGVRREPARRKANSIGMVSPGRELESPTVPVPASFLATCFGAAMAGDDSEVGYRLVRRLICSGGVGGTDRPDR